MEVLKSEELHRFLKKEGLVRKYNREVINHEEKVAGTRVEAGYVFDNIIGGFTWSKSYDGFNFWDKVGERFIKFTKK